MAASDREARLSNVIETRHTSTVVEALLAELGGLPQDAIAVQFVAKRLSSEQLARAVERAEECSDSRTKAFFTEALRVREPEQRPTLTGLPSGLWGEAKVLEAQTTVIKELMLCDGSEPVWEDLVKISIAMAQQERLPIDCLHPQTRRALYAMREEHEDIFKYFGFLLPAKMSPEALEKMRVFGDGPICKLLRHIDALQYELEDTEALVKKLREKLAKCEESQV